jgi:hypothetical protein
MRIWSILEVYLITLQSFLNRAKIGRGILQS